MPMQSSSRTGRAKPSIEERYMRVFQSCPNAVRAGDKRAFEIYFGWSILPPDAPVRVVSVSSTREEELAVATGHCQRD